MAAPLPEKKYLFISDKKNTFEISFSIDNSSFLLISAKSQEKNFIRNYENKYSLKDIKQNQYFSDCESINEVIIMIESILLSYKLTIHENTNEIMLIVPIPHNIVHQVQFKLIEKKIEKVDNISLYSMIQELTKKIENQNQIINEQNIKIKNLENQLKKINDLEDLIIQQNKLMIDKEESKVKDKKKKEKHKNPYKHSFSKLSQIIPKDYEKEKIIRNWINTEKEIDFDLIFTMSKDGSNSKDFHNNCDRKGATLILIETTKGNKFGGYTPLNWDNTGFKSDNDTFIFFLNNMEKINKIEKNNNNYSINGKDTRGPVFGNADIVIMEDMKKGKFICNEISCFLTDLKFNDGESDFDVKEIEVFQVK